MTAGQSIFLGLLQGLTEFLPVSSSGHLVIAQELLGLTQPPVLFDILVHLATALAIVIVVWPGLRKLDFKLLKLIVIASLPAGAVGLLVNNYTAALFSSLKLVAIGLLITALFLFLARSFFPQAKKQAMSFVDSLVIGLFQALAIVPGISRSGSTISAGIFRKLKPETAFEFSFLLALPAIAGAVLLQLKDLNSFLVSPVMVAGFLAAFFSGWASLVLLRKIVSQGWFNWLAIYCLILGLVLMLSKN